MIQLKTLWLNKKSKIKKRSHDKKKNIIKILNRWSIIYKILTISEVNFKPITLVLL